jgi:hypothetical protein
MVREELIDHDAVAGPPGVVTVAVIGIQASELTGRERALVATYIPR